MQQVYEVNALEEGAEGVVEREVEELLKMRGEMMDVERTRAGGSKRGVVGGGKLFCIIFLRFILKDVVCRC